MKIKVKIPSKQVETELYLEDWGNGCPAVSIYNSPIFIEYSLPETYNYPNCDYLITEPSIRFQNKDKDISTGDYINDGDEITILVLRN